MNPIFNISKLWQSFLTLPFPEQYAGAKIKGVCVTSLDATAAGLISGFDGRLNQTELKLLHSCLADFDKILPELDEPAKNYFQQLRTLCLEVDACCR